jgi:hypothetical protein
MEGKESERKKGDGSTVFCLGRTKIKEKSRNDKPFRLCGVFAAHLQGIPDFLTG